MTTADKINQWVNHTVNTTGEAVSLTTIFDRTRPISMETLSHEAISFTYADGSRFTTSLCADAEWNELEALYERITP